MPAAPEVAAPPRASLPRWRLLLSLALTGGLLALLLWRLGPARVLAALAGLDPAWLLGAALAGLASPLAGALRWRQVLLAMGSAPPYRRCLALTYAAIVPGAVTPSRLGEAIKAWGIRRELDLASGLGSVVAERGLDLATLGLMTLAGALALGHPRVAALAVAWLVALAGGAGLLLLLHAHLPAGRLGRLSRALAALKRHPGRGLAAWGGSLLNWGCALTVAWACFRAAGAPLGFAAVAARFPAAVLAGLVPVTLAGLGTRDAAILWLFAGLAPAERLLAGSLSYYLTGYLVLAAAGAVPFFRLVREPAITPEAAGPPGPG